MRLAAAQPAVWEKRQRLGALGGWLTAVAGQLVCRAFVHAQAHRRLCGRILVHWDTVGCLYGLLRGRVPRLSGIAT